LAQFSRTNPLGYQLAVASVVKLAGEHLFSLGPRHVHSYDAQRMEGEVMSILYIGIDLAKNVSTVHGVNEAGAVELRQPRVTRAKLHELIASLPPCVIGMEACSGAHHWARLFRGYGDTVRLMAPKFVAPYRMSGKQGKNDAADAMAICEAVQRPSMRFVPIKTEEQQSRLLVHRARQGFVQARTATINRIRGLMSEFGSVLPLKAEVVRCEARNHLEDLRGYANTVVGDLLSCRRRSKSDTGGADAVALSGSIFGRRQHIVPKSAVAAYAGTEGFERRRLDEDWVDRELRVYTLHTAPRLRATDALIDVLKR
jgi:hypothetical protein